MPIPLSRASEQLKYHFTALTIAARPTQWQVSLHTGNPVLGNEVATGSISNYARQDTTFDYSTVAVGGVENAAQVANATAITFPTVPAASSNVTVTHVAVWDKVSGALKAYGPLTPNITTADGTIVSFNVGDLFIRD